MSHMHMHADSRADRRILALSLGLLLAFMVAEVVLGIVASSLALLADAGHMLTDASALGLALFAAWAASLPARGRWTFGFARAEILAAQANGITLVVIGLLIVYSAIRRLISPPEVEAGIVTVVAVVGIVVNLAVLALMARAERQSLNVRGAYLEVLGDLLGSVAVIVAAVVIALTGFVQADTFASILIAVMILPRAWSLLRDVVNVLLEATPKHVDVASIREHIMSADGLVDVHDIHIWTITSGVPVFSAHVVVADETLHAEGIDRVLDRLSGCLGSHFDTEHCTFQIEPLSHADHETRHHD